ncbi:MAG: hypothetical protein WCF92_02710 [bacterium]
MNNHPELMPGEVFFSNIETLLEDGQISDFETWPANTFSSRRLGQTAYDIKGTIIPNSVPIFVSQDECKEKNIDQENPLRKMIESMCIEGK